MQELQNQVVVLQEFPHNVQEEIFTIFMRELRNFLRNETHPYRKFTEIHVVELLNHIAKHYNEVFDLTMSFYLNKDGHIGMESDNMAYEIGVVPDMFKQFKKCYRCREKCYERKTRGVVTDVS